MKKTKHSLSSLFSWWTRSRGHLPHFHSTFLQNLNVKKQELPVISRGNNKEKEITHREQLFHSAEIALSPQHSLNNALRQRKRVQWGKSVLFIRLTLLCSALFTHIWSSVTRVYSSAFQWFLPFRSRSPSLYPSRVSLSSLPFRTEMFSGRYSEPSSGEGVRVSARWWARCLNELARADNLVQKVRVAQCEHTLLKWLHTPRVGVSATISELGIEHAPSDGWGAHCRKGTLQTKTHD